MKGHRESRASLALKREIGDEEGQAISLHQLSMLYRLKGTTRPRWLAARRRRSWRRKAETSRRRGRDLHQQGLIFTRLARAAADRRRGRDPPARRPSNASRRAWRSAGASGARPARPKALGELGKLWLDAGQVREAIDPLPRHWKYLRARENPARWARPRTSAPSTNARAITRRAERSAGVGVLSSRPATNVGGHRAYIAWVRGKMGSG